MKSINKLIGVALWVIATSHSINAQPNMKNVLNQRQQNIVAIACFEAKGDLKSLSEALHTGLDMGLTDAEYDKLK